MLKDCKSEVILYLCGLLKSHINLLARRDLYQCENIRWIYPLREAWWIFTNKYHYTTTIFIKSELLVETFYLKMTIWETIVGFGFTNHQYIYISLNLLLE